MPILHFTRHVFVTGASGAGKTNTMLNLVEALDGAEVPVLIIDPAKRDFEPLMTKLGREVSLYDFRQWWLKFNPFLCAENVTLYAHSVILAKAFSMLFPTNAVAHEMVLSIIKDAYWQKLLERGLLWRPEDPRLDCKDWGKIEQLNTAVFVGYTGALLRQKPYLAPTFPEFVKTGLDKLRARAAAAGGAVSPFYREALEYFERRWEALGKSAFSVMLTPSHPYRVVDSLFSRTSLVEFYSWFDSGESNAAFALLFSMLYE
jgi:hypothetical protein